MKIIDGDDGEINVEIWRGTRVPVNGETGADGPGNYAVEQSPNGARFRGVGAGFFGITKRNRKRGGQGVRAEIKKKKHRILFYVVRYARAVHPSPGDRRPKYKTPWATYRNTKRGIRLPSSGPADVRATRENGRRDAVFTRTPHTRTRKRDLRKTANNRIEKRTENERKRYVCVDAE